MRGSSRLPARFPVGTKYVLEGRGPFVRRYVEFPNGRRVQLEVRKAQTCNCAAWQGVSIAPAIGTDGRHDAVKEQYSPSATSF
jgi:hypothetical protein